MNPDNAKSPLNFPASLERRIILLLCFLAACHVFIFSAAFPPINNVDESVHLDLAVKYSHGHLPRGMEPRYRESLNYVVIYGSQEFLNAPETCPEGKFPPPLWTQPPEKVWQIFLALAGMILFMIIAEIKTDWTVFSSPYNWFHM